MTSTNKAKYIVIAVFFVFLAFWFLTSAPLNFPTGAIFTIEKGESLLEVANNLENSKIIRSKNIFQVLVMALASDKNVISGEYMFPGKESVLGVVLRLTRGIYLIPASKITVPEGATNVQIAELFSLNFHNFDKNNFLKIADDKEGYIFPDTYLFLPATDEKEVLRVMTDNFNKKISSFEEKIKNSGHSLGDIITMASIIEKEAGGSKDGAIISGILWKRIDKGMVLQVDAPFLYILGKGSGSLTRADLAVDSPYNTYLYKGLPPGPIGNPGLIAINSALNPVQSSYFFYLHDSHGNIYYARTYAEHMRNRAKYLRN